MNRKLTTGVPKLHPVTVKSAWHMIGIDFIGPISPESEDGSRYILTISDYFTKWVEALPTTDKYASTVATALFKVYIYCFGCVILYIFKLRIVQYLVSQCTLPFPGFHANGHPSGSGFRSGTRIQQCAERRTGCDSRDIKETYNTIPSSGA